MQKEIRQHKRGIHINTRLILTIVLILLQIALFVFSVSSMAKKAFGLYSLLEFASIITVIYIVNVHGNQSYKIMWIIFILLFPVFGVIAYMLFGGGRMFPSIKKRMLACEKKYMSQLPDDSVDMNRLNYSDMMHSRQAMYLKQDSGFPIYGNTRSEFLTPGEVAYPKFLEELEKAEKYIYIEFFILAEGKMWDGICDILKRKAAEGVEIKIIFDDFGSIKRQYKGFASNLRQAGIQVSAFNPILPLVNIFMNNRDHRKIIIIDGKVAFTGGINIGDEYINKLERFGYWLDCAILLEGKAVDSFLAMFCSMWEFTTGKAIDMRSHLADHKVPTDGFYIPYCDGPLNSANPAEGIYMQILNNAQKYVYIASPYLIIDSNMMGALILAAKSGVDVRIATPFVPDKNYVHPVTQSYYTDLLEAGVKIYEFKPGFIHSKFFVSDDNVATVGTVNMDYRSFYFHFECGVWFSGSSTVKDIKRHFEEIVNVSKPIELNIWKKRSLWLRIKQSLLRLIAPFM